MMESLPLGEKSPNIQETDVASRKRSHDEFASEDVIHLVPDQEPKRPLNTSINPADASREYKTRVLHISVARLTCPQCCLLPMTVCIVIHHLRDHQL